MKTVRRSLPVAFAFLASAAGAQFNPAPMVEPEYLVAEVVATRDHDPKAFTQGLEFRGADLLESTGMYGESSLRRTDPATGETIQRVDLPPKHFGEGLTVVDDRIIQLTWREGVAHVWNVETFQKMGEYRYEGEGWGLCYDGTRLIMSDGTPNLSLRDPNTFAEIRKQAIIFKGRPLKYLNELEFAEGFVWGNIWRTEEIVKIDAETGQVRALVRAPGLLRPEQRQGTDVLNGIAWNPATKTFLITGKYWPAMFEVRFVPTPPTPTPAPTPTPDPGADTAPGDAE